MPRIKSAPYIYKSRALGSSSHRNTHTKAHLQVMVNRARFNCPSAKLPSRNRPGSFLSHEGTMSLALRRGINFYSGTRRAAWHYTASRWRDYLWSRKGPLGREKRVVSHRIKSELKKQFMPAVRVSPPGALISPSASFSNARGLIFNCLRLITAGGLLNAVPVNELLCGRKWRRCCVRYYKAW